jgi:hypothetical protein
MARRTPRQIAAQVAVEYVANYRADFDDDVRLAVLEVGEAEGVAELYLELIR